MATKLTSDQLMYGSMYLAMRNLGGGRFLRNVKTTQDLIEAWHQMQEVEDPEPERTSFILDLKNGNKLYTDLLRKELPFLFTTGDAPTTSNLVFGGQQKRGTEEPEGFDTWSDVELLHEYKRTIDFLWQRELEQEILARMTGRHPGQQKLGAEMHGADYYVKYDQHDYDLVLVIPEVLWWDDGGPGGGDWIAQLKLSEENLPEDLTALGVTEDDALALVEGRLDSAPVDNAKGNAFVKARAAGDSTLYYRPDRAMLQAEHGRIPCPGCKGLVNVEPDAESVYCPDCNKTYPLRPLV